MTFRSGNRVRIDWLALWIYFSGSCSLLGWTLSVLGQLNAVGYLLGFLSFLFFLGQFGRRLGIWNESSSSIARHYFRNQFLVPKLWLGLAVLIFLGGALYTPNNYDYLTYRFPRVLHWAWEQKWYWVPTVNDRINYSGAGFEWLMTPMYVFFKTDRLFFLLNFVSYLFLPGLIFSVFRRMGISDRICWWWMWVLPFGYCYALQAGSVGNDSYATIYLLAALHYALRKEGAPSINLVLSGLAVALLTGVKATNLPLALPWLLVIVWRRAFLFQSCRPVLWVVIALFGAVISILPIALLNTHFAGDYSGDPKNLSAMKLTSPAAGLIGNGLQLASNNLTPPLWYRKIDWMPLVPARLSPWLETNFPRLTLRMGEMQIEETAGAGLGLTLFVILTLLMSISARIADPILIKRHNPLAVGMMIASLVALLVFMSKLGSESTSRLLAAYYPLLIAGALSLASLDGSIVRRRIHLAFGLAAMASTFPLLVLNPARPLFPVGLIGEELSRFHVPASLVARYDEVYQVYGGRSHIFSNLLEAIPDEERNIGLVQNGNVAEAPLWRPFGVRQVNDVILGESRESLSNRGIHFIIVSDEVLKAQDPTGLTGLLGRWSATLVAKEDIVVLAQRGSESWYLIRVPSPPRG